MTAKVCGRVVSPWPQRVLGNVKHMATSRSTRCFPTPRGARRVGNKGPMHGCHALALTFFLGTCR